eukprot:scaffold11.g3937.t1
MSALQRRNARGWKLLALAFATLGVVYGDIGTSILYTWGAVFPDGAPDDAKITLGVMSTIFWTFTSIVGIKYVVLMLMADDNGEGGLMALYALICRATGVRSAAASHATDAVLTQFADSGRLLPAEAEAEARGAGRSIAAKTRALFQGSKVLQTLLLLTVMIGSNLVLSDGVLTPAISVVSAVEGIQHQANISRGAVVGISVAILVLLFGGQPLGTHRMAALFSPVMLLWFGANLAIGAWNISRFGAGVFRALSPHYMYYFWSGRASEAWRQLGAVLLAITGAEALYADLGHFSAAAIRISFGSAVYPSLMITYLGQCAMILDDPSTSSSAFWASLPTPVYWPMVVLATLAAIIASQAMALNCFPRMTVRHTSADVAGQIYMPAINWALMLACICVVALFQTSAKIGNAYGLAVVSVMLMDTFLLALLELVGWGWHVLAVAAFWLFFTFITGAYFSSTMEKVPSGAWFPLAICFALTIYTYTWTWGQSRKAAYVREHKVRLRDLFEEAPPSPSPKADAAAAATGPAPGGAGEAGAARAGGRAPRTQRLRLAGSGARVARVPGIGVYYNELLDGVPPVLVRFLGQVPAIHEVVIFLTNRRARMYAILHVPVPTVLSDERLLVCRLRFRGFYHVVARYGYLDVADQGPEFISLVLAEIAEYLDPEVGGIAVWESHRDLEAGGGGAPPPPVSRYSIGHDGMHLLPPGEPSKAAPGAGGDAPTRRTWVQQPSMLRRRVSATQGAAEAAAKGGDATQSLSLPPCAGAPRDLADVLRAAGVEGGPSAGASLPLPADPTRPALPRPAAFAAAPSPHTSLPLPASLSRPPIYRLPSEPPPDPAATMLKGAAATSVAAAFEALRRAERADGAAAAAAAAPADSTAPPVEGEGGEGEGAGGAPPRRQVIHVQSSAGSNSERARGAAIEGAAERELLAAALGRGVTMMVGVTYEL